MKEILDDEGQPIHDYPEKLNSPHYKEYSDHFEFLVMRQYFEGTPISWDDHKELVNILKIPKKSD